MAAAAPTASSWCTIESDPGVFTALLEDLGVRRAEVAELWGFEMLRDVGPVHGVLFLFKWQPEQDERRALSPVETDPELFYAKQVISNACATQALLSVVLNARSVDVGPFLGEFRSFTREFDPQLKGEAIGDAETVRKAHNAFARPEPFAADEDLTSRQRDGRDEDEDDQVYHYVAYVPFKGHLYELDGLKPGPFRLAAVSEQGDEWLAEVEKHVKARIERYNGDIRFNLMAVVQDRRVTAAAALETAEAEARVATAHGVDVAEAQARVRLAREQLAQFEEEHQLWAIENVRRRHNYVPFIVASLKFLAKRRKLKGLVRAAQERQLARQQRNAAAQAGMSTELQHQQQS